MQFGGMNQGGMGMPQMGGMGGMGGMNMGGMGGMGGMNMGGMNMGGMNMGGMGGMNMGGMNMAGMGGMNMGGMNMPGMGGMNMPGMGGMNMPGMGGMNMPGMGGMQTTQTDNNTNMNIEDAQGWNLIFENQNDKTSVTIRISEQKLVKEAISLYMLKSGRSDKCKFIFNNKELFTEMKICQSGLNNLSRILVISTQNVIGAN